MNRLNKMYCYLSGPIDFAHNLGKQWREDLTPFLEAKNVTVLNPLKHIFYGASTVDTIKRPKMEELLNNGDYTELREEIQELQRWDLRCVDLSSFIIVNYDINTFTCGTHDEMFMGERQRKPILLKIGEGNRKKLPKWIYGRFPPSHLFETWDELKDYLNKVDNDPNYVFTNDDLKRWIFFSGKHMDLSNIEKEYLSNIEKEELRIKNAIENSISKSPYCRDAIGAWKNDLMSEEDKKMFEKEDAEIFKRIAIAVNNFKEGIVSEPIDLDKYKDDPEDWK